LVLTHGSYCFRLLKSELFKLCRLDKESRWVIGSSGWHRRLLRLGPCGRRYLCRSNCHTDRRNRPGSSVWGPDPTRNELVQRPYFTTLESPTSEFRIGLRIPYLTPFLSQRRKVAKLFMLIASWRLCEKYLLTK